MVDALVALAIFATTLSLCLTLANTAMGMGARASELRRANLLGRYLLETSPKTAGVTDGRTDGFLWQVSVQSSPVTGEPQMKLCDRSVDLHAADTGRRFGFSTVELCPPSVQ